MVLVTMAHAGRWQKMGKGFGRVLAVLGTAAAMAAILWAGGRALERSYVLWNGALLPRDAQSLTLSGKTMRRPEAFLRFADLRQLDARGTGMTASQYEWFRHYKLFQLMNFLRILQYAKEPKVVDYLKNVLNQLLYEF